MSRYRQNVGMMIINRDGQVFMGRRCKATTPYFLQMPQGGINAGENPTQALWRELHEETGLLPQDVKLLAVSKKWYQYDLPLRPARRMSIKGQRQKWFLLLLTAPESHISFNMAEHQEFTGYQWMAPDEIVAAVIPFRREVYQKVIAEFSPVIQQPAD